MTNYHKCTPQPIYRLAVSAQDGKDGEILDSSNLRYCRVQWERVPHYVESANAIKRKLFVFTLDFSQLII